MTSCWCAEGEGVREASWRKQVFELDLKEWVSFIGNLICSETYTCVCIYVISIDNLGSL